MKKIVLISLLFFVSGCEDFPVYEQFLTNQKSFECINVDINDTELLKSVKSELEIKSQKNCPYVLSGYIHNSEACTSLYAKTHGTDFNGYVYFDIKKDNKRLYRAQSDFKDDPESAIKRVVTKINTITK